MEATAPAAFATCASCHRQVPSHVLAYDGSARLVCPSCEADREMADVAKQSFTRLVIGPPLLALIGTLGICVPVLSLFLPITFGFIAVAGGFSALRTGISGTPAEGVTDSNKVFLILSGLVGGMWGLALIGINLLAWIGLSYA